MIEEAENNEEQEAPDAAAPVEPELPDFFDANTPGRLAYEAVAKYPRWWRPETCDGLQIWRSYLDQKPDATLGECLDYFRQRMEQGGDPQWSFELLRSIGCKAFPELSTVAVKYLDARRAYLVRRKGLYQTPQQRKILERKTRGFVMRRGRTCHGKGLKDR